MNIDDEVNLVYQVINLPCGYDIGWGPLLGIRRYEHPKWVVEWELWFSNENRKLEFREFEDPMQAARFFVSKRHELKLGFEYETENSPEI